MIFYSLILDYAINNAYTIYRWVYDKYDNIIPILENLFNLRKIFLVQYVGHLVWSTNVNIPRFVLL